MGREVKRVPLDFDWPVGVIWPGATLGVCDSMENIISDDYPVERCEMCKKWATLAGLKFKRHGCPEIPASEPPLGDAYQLWEDLTEGSPCSPPFATPEELAQYLVDNKVPSFGYQTESYETWLSFINNHKWTTCSIFTTETGFRSGVAGFVALEIKEKNLNNNQQPLPANPPGH